MSEAATRQEINGLLPGRTAYLPDDELVIVEEVYADGYATVRRVNGDFAGTIAVCKGDSLRIVEDPSSSSDAF